jgi:tRNA(Ile)-lysidine synthase
VNPRTLPLRVLEAVRTHGLWSPGQTVLLAVSGGLDSVALMHLLHRTAGAHGGRLSVASVDHGLRPEAAGEVAAVGRQAAELGLAFRPLAVELTTGANLAERARDARRAVLAGLDTDCIATGHHRDDQAETVLLHLLRGAGTQGLRGMSWWRGPWVRPLLAVPRAELLAWAEAEGLEWVEDPSNPSSLRGRLRAIMPALDALHGGSSASLGRAARLLAREDDLISQLAGLAWREVVVEGLDGRTGLSWAGLRAQHPALQLRLLRRLVEGGPTQARADQLEAVLLWKGEGEVGLSQGWSLSVEAGVLQLSGPVEGRGPKL